MHSDRWRNCTEIFNVAVEQPPNERAGFLDRSCDGDEALRRKVELLLKYHDAAGDFIKSPAFKAAPEMLVGDPKALIGQRLGCYRVDAVAGVGGMGVVYLAWDERLGRKVALKLLPQSMVANEAELGRLKREARTASALNHPNIVTIHDIGEVDSTYYVATEFIEGITLRERMTKSPIPPSEAVDIAAQVASALCVAHRAGIVHRDIKPENIMLRPDGYVKVLDFGIAKFTQQETLDTTTVLRAESATQRSLALGTTRYMSPEQAMAQQVDARSDLWSLGVVLYEMLAGRTPFEGETATDVIAAIFESDPQPLKLRAPIVPPGLQSVVDRCLRKDPAERYQTAEELLSELRAIKEKADGIRAQSSRWIALTAVAAMLVGLALFYATRGGRTAPERATAVTDKSIAVLPFENLSKDEENAFLAGGVQDEILTDLAKVADLKVISRTSVMKYKSGLERNLREIAKTLGVSHVVEGSVQRAGGRVRVSAQLIDARSDTHLWAQHYDRDVADIFAIQSEIAQQIAHQLRANLSASEKAAIAERPTADLVAYAYYTKANEINIDTDNWEGAEKNGDQKVELLEKATQRDPNFALAYCELAKTHLNLGNDDAEHRRHIEFAKTAAETAVRLRPDLAEAHLALARYYFEVGVQTDINGYDRAREELAIIRRRLPNNAEALMIEALIGRHQSSWDASLANLHKASELDPRNGEVAYRLEQIYFEMRRYSEFEQLIRKEAASGGFPLEDPFIQTWLAQMKLAQGDPVAAQSILEQVPLEYSVWGTRFMAALYLRDYDAANRVIAATPPKYADNAFDLEHGSENWAYGLVARARGDKQKALAAFAAAREKLDSTRGDNPKDAPYFSCIAKLDAGLGRKEEAIREAQRAVELTPIGKDSLNGPDWVANLALVYAWTGERDRALEQLEKIATIPGSPGSPTYGDLLLNPCWDDLRGNPRFDKIIAAAKAASSYTLVPLLEKSIAVLPLENLSGDSSQEYFADGITEALITDLSRITATRIMSRSSVMQYKGDRKPLAQVARELKVDALLTGSVARSGERVRVAVQLVDPSSNRNLWADSYEGDLSDVLVLQRKLARDVAGQIQLKPRHAQQRPDSIARRVNAEAYDQYLRGRFYLNRQTKDDNKAAIDALERAVAIDSTFADAYAGLAQAYVWKLFLFAPNDQQSAEKAFVAAEKALALEPDLAAAHLARGRLLWTPANHFPHEKAIQEYRRALELDPTLDEARNQLALVYCHIGAFDQALQQAKEAVATNPNNNLAQFRIGQTLNFQGKYEEALTVLRGIPPEANPALVGHQMAWALFNLGRPEEASAMLDKLLKDYPEDTGGVFTSIQAVLAASAGEGLLAEAKINSAVERGKGYGHFHHTAYQIACAYALMNKPAQAIKWIEAAADDGFPCCPLFERDTNLDSLRQDERFVTLLMKLKQQWEHYRTLF